MLDQIEKFLLCKTPAQWIEAALQNEHVLLIDHANCEKKAAATAMSLMYRHTRKTDLLAKMSQLAREELLHFQQVVEIMAGRSIDYVRLSPSRYAGKMREHIRQEPEHELTDTLLVGAFIEARSCERFACIAPHLDEQLQKFYRGLLRSEARHYEDYLALAQAYTDEDIHARVAILGGVEAELISSPDTEFRFHSGIPA